MVTLVLIDVQNDFHPGGSLAIPSANDDAARIAKLIQENPTKISRIVATMDSHQKLHIAHPGFWRSGDATDDSEKLPDPFTIITSADIIAGKWKPRSDLRISSDTVDGRIFEGLEHLKKSDGYIDLYKYSIEYTKRLEEKGKFKLCIWPEHCLIGSSGHNMVEPVLKAVLEWSQTTGNSVEWIMKGEHLLTESYSAIEAEVPVSVGTSFNTKLQGSLESSDHIIFCGQAMSHCVNYTVRNFMDRCSRRDERKISIMTDCSSSVPGFEKEGELFQVDMSEIGVQLATSSSVFDQNL